jgi:hypothetical protein
LVTETCTIERTRCGSYNRVFFLREYPDLVVRVSKSGLDQDEQRDYREDYRRFNQKMCQ